ncbi:hypothetical protein HK097_002164 [Rhizophlyctis rosea]|uniref:phosphogluconate dehydrogenase (NADP(+)-dependent, decarboxylating) n=1 Tax=Rhizophlyctis rosea TaxID=64517 RepID=A0AAD5SBF7_9FUNG|nr:hypothetical protein HK097_002164 [Rhizophlyctis rosea]
MPVPATKGCRLEEGKTATAHLPHFRFLPIENNQIDIIGAGSMDSNMSMLFAQHGLSVSIFDISPNITDTLMQNVHKTESVKDKVTGYKDYDSFLESLDDSPNPKLIILSVSHGSPGDQVLKELRKGLKKGDVILDGGNEYYEATERRQKALREEMNAELLSLGVSVMPLLASVAPKASDGSPCVRIIGPGASGHFVKMAHNGIEQGMMSNTCFLISIATDICTTKPDETQSYLATRIQDKVVQAADDTEGTEFWTVREGAMRHVSIPTIAAAQFHPIASANRAERVRIA